MDSNYFEENVEKVKGMEPLSIESQKKDPIKELETEAFQLQLVDRFF